MTVDEIPNVRTCITPLKNNNKILEQDRIGAISNKKFIERKRKKLDVDIVIVGSGPAGMMAATAAAKQKVPSILLVDENHIIGGQLVKQTHKFFGSKEEKAGVRGIDIALSLLDEIKTSLKKSKVCWRSSCVSPGNPKMKSKSTPYP